MSHRLTASGNTKCEALQRAKMNGFPGKHSITELHAKPKHCRVLEQEVNDASKCTLQTQGKVHFREQSTGGSWFSILSEPWSKCPLRAFSHAALHAPVSNKWCQ